MNIFWFRRDLRLDDNAALFRALSAGNVLPIFIFDTNILGRLRDKRDRRVSFIYHRLETIKVGLEQAGTTLQVFHGRPEQIFRRLLSEYPLEMVFAGKDYEAYAKQRDQAVSRLLKQHRAELVLVKDHVIFDPAEIVKADGSPYVVYTPYMRAWKKNYLLAVQDYFPSAEMASGFARQKPRGLMPLEDTGFTDTGNAVVDPVLDPEVLREYDKRRDYPALAATSLAGPHLRFGTISVRRLVAMAMDLNQVWLNQLIWREFFIQILDHFPHTATQSFRPAYDAIPWRNDRQDFARWCAGETGFPIIDAGMRQLSATGYMHNRTRMISANFLTKLLLIDWRMGEAWFAEKLLDYEMANNVGGWQWACGSGCDAAPYFRIFNPDTQIRKFDPELKYIRRWIPEFDTLEYPQPMLDYRQARERALAVYKNTLLSQKALHPGSG